MADNHYNNAAFKTENTYVVSKQETWFSMYIKATDIDSNLQECAAAINAFVKDNQLIPLFALDSQTLCSEISAHRFLVANRLALCFSDGEEVDKPEYKDRYFSLSLVKEPIRCSQAHLLERRFALLWTQARGNTICPEGSHTIENFQIDKQTQYDITQYQNSQGEKKTAISTIAAKQLYQQMQIDQQGAQIVQLSHQLNKPVVCMDVAKIPLSVASGVTSIMLKQVEKVAAKAGEKIVATWWQNLLKQLPIASLVLGVANAVLRIKKDGLTLESGIKAFLEVGSGACSFVPGIGTAVSVVIDGSLMVHDIYSSSSSSSSSTQDVTMTATATINLQSAYRYLGLQENSSPSKEVVDAAYRRQVSLVHPDHLKEFGDQVNLITSQMTSGLNAAKDLIYTSRGW